MQSREGMPLGKARCWASHEARCLAQRRMAVGPSHPQRMPQTAMTVISTKRCLRLRVCRGSESDSKYEPMELTSTSLATGVILGSVDDGFRAPNQGVRQPEDNDRIKDSEPRSVAPDYPDRTAMRAGRGYHPRPGSGRDGECPEPADHRPTVRRRRRAAVYTRPAVLLDRRDDESGRLSHPAVDQCRLSEERRAYQRLAPGDLPQAQPHRDRDRIRLGRQVG